MGNEIMNGLPCEKWQYSSAFGDKSSTYTLWLKKEVVWCRMDFYAELDFNHLFET